MARVISAQDKKWQEESDAHVLADAEVIKSTPKRLAGARRGAKRLAAEQSKIAATLQKVAGKKVKPKGRKKG